VAGRIQHPKTPIQVFDGVQHPRRSVANGRPDDTDGKIKPLVVLET
jgi:hypothetical protein